MSPLTKCDTIAPNLEINEILFRQFDPDVHADLWYKNGIDRSRNAWAMSAWKRRTSFAPTQGLHISGYVPSKHRYCKSHISSRECNIWIITTRQLRVYVTLFFPYFSHPYFIKKKWMLISEDTFTSYWNANLVLEQNSSVVFRRW